MNPYMGFFKRIWAAIKFIFRPQLCGFGHWAECLVSKEQVKEIKDMCNEFLED